MGHRKDLMSSFGQEDEGDEGFVTLTPPRTQLSHDSSSIRCSIIRHTSPLTMLRDLSRGTAARSRQGAIVGRIGRDFGSRRELPEISAHAWAT